MDQFALRDSTAIEFLVDGDAEEVDGGGGKSKKKKKWRERMANKEKEGEVGVLFLILDDNYC